MLPEPNFINRDVSKITQEMIAKYEQDTGKTLQPAQQERLMIDLIAYRENLIRIAIQEAAKQNLVNYATYPMLDYLGELVGVPRLEPQYSKTTVRFLMNETKTYVVDIPAGTQVESKDGKVIFSTINNATIPIGQLYIDIPVQSDVSGEIGNNYLAGEINSLVSNNLTDIDSVSNTIITSGGAEEENDDPYRERIKKAPEQFSTAGSRGAYEFLAKSAHQDIIDVAVIRPQTLASVSYRISGIDYTAQEGVAGTIEGTHITSGSIDYTTGEMELVFDQPASNVTCTIPPAATVKVYPLTKYGNPSTIIKNAVNDMLNAESKRPLTDNVIVEDPIKVDFSILTEVTLFDYADEIIVKAEIEEKLAAYAADLKTKLGKDIVPAQIISIILSVSGVYNATLSSPVYRALNGMEWANCTSITVNIAGVVNG